VFGIQAMFSQRLLQLTLTECHICSASVPLTGRCYAEK